MKLLEGKVAIVTGGSRGIGKAVVLKFASQGANVAFTSRSLDANALETEKEAAAFGVKVKAYASDASNFDATHQLVSEIAKEFGRIDVLVNNAGITKDTLLLRMTEEQWDTVITVNLKSAFNFVHAITPIMMKQRSGSVINMSSIVGLVGNNGQVNYAASKAGMIGLTKSVAKELGSRGVRANTIAPGFIITDMTHQLSEEQQSGWVSQVPLKRGGEAEEVAGVALFLASDLSSYVTGQTISVCGGKNLT